MKGEGKRRGGLVLCPNITDLMLGVSNRTKLDGFLTFLKPSKKGTSKATMVWTNLSAFLSFCTETALCEASKQPKDSKLHARF